MPSLFDPIQIKNLTCKNRIMMSPMCQYSVTSLDGRPDEWHLIHYTSRAIGGTGLIMIEMTGIDPDGRITEKDLGLWSDEQIPYFQQVIASCQKYGAKVGIQIGHAGRKSLATDRPDRCCLERRQSATAAAVALVPHVPAAIAGDRRVEMRGRAIRVVNEGSARHLELDATISENSNPFASEQTE